jgi:hypothetical protein
MRKKRRLERPANDRRQRRDELDALFMVVGGSRELLQEGKTRERKERGTGRGVAALQGSR